MARQAVADGSYVEYLRRKPGGKCPEPGISLWTACVYIVGVNMPHSLQLLYADLRAVLSGILEGRWISDDKACVVRG